MIKPNTLLSKYREKEVGSYLLVAFIFSLTFSTSLTEILSFFIVLNWFVAGNIRNKLHEIANNKIVLAVLAYVVLNIIALLWTEDLSLGLTMLKAHRELILLPFFLSSVRRDHIKYYTTAFVAGMTMSVLASILVWQGVILSHHGSAVDATAFMTRITYTPFLSLAIFIVLDSILNHFTGRRKKIAIAIILLLIFGLFLSQGRTGHIAFVFLFCLSFLQFYKTEPFKAFFTATILLALIFSFAYNFIDNFQSRINKTATVLELPISSADESIYYRTAFIINSWELITRNPLYGVGTGDFVNEYEKINKKNSPDCIVPAGPHNQYLLALSLFGISGLIVVCLIFYLQYKFWLDMKDELSRFRIGFIVFYQLIMMSGSYLMIGHSPFLYVAFSAFLFKEFPELQQQNSV